VGPQVRARFQLGAPCWGSVALGPSMLLTLGPGGVIVTYVHEFAGQVAQLVEQRTENPCVGSSTLPLPNDGRDAEGRS
jgi:hypothetical protein